SPCCPPSGPAATRRAGPRRAPRRLSAPVTPGSVFLVRPTITDPGGVRDRRAGGRHGEVERARLATVKPISRKDYALPVLAVVHPVRRHPARRSRAAARPASSRATGTRNGEQDT